MAIGSLGDVVFEVSAEKIRTFDGLQRTSTARIGTHELMRLKPLLEFIGPGLEQLSFKIRLDASIGVDPKTELETLRAMRDKGEIVQFILDGSPVSENYWLVEQISEDYKYVDNQGKLLIAEASVSLKEYVKPGVSTSGS